MKLKIFSLSLIGLTSLALSSPTFAVNVASVSFDWSQFNVTSTALSGGTAPVLTLQDLGTELFADTSATSDSDFFPDWTTQGNVLVGSGQPALATAGFDTNDNLSATSLSWSDYADAEVWRYGDYSVAGSGLLVFQIPYTMEVEIDGEAGDFAYAYVDLVIERDDLSGNGSDEFFAKSELILEADGFSGPESESKNRSLTLALIVEDGDILNFEAYGYTLTDALPSTAPIPTPAAFWLLTTALAGLAGFSRRK